MLLAQTKDPRAVQPHMNKCFEGIMTVNFTDKDEVESMVSAENEVVQFTTKVDVNEGDKKGNVEKWMLEIEHIMCKSLKNLMKESLVDYVKSGRAAWVKKWPGQIILAVDQVHWTTGVENAIKDYSQGGLEDYKVLLNEQIEGIVFMVRGDLPN